jgi:glutaminase
MPNTSAEVAPGHELQAMVNDVYARCLPIDAGEVATYIPELSKANPDDFGVCVATSDGAYRVGVPAKSGVGGGVIAVVNRQLGVSTYSPRLDRYGNSCRGTAVCVELASQLGLHVFDCLNLGSRFLDAIL